MGLATDTVSPGEGRIGRPPARCRPADGPRRSRNRASYLTDRQRWSGPIVESETELGFLGATASGYIQQQTGGHYPAPLAALEVMLGAAGLRSTRPAIKRPKGWPACSARRSIGP